MFTTSKIVQVSVINDLVTDSRVKKICDTLVECGCEVQLTGRVLKHSLPLPRWNYSAQRMHLLFTKGPLFYFFFNVRLFFKLWFSKAHLLYANDLDTLLPNFLVSRLKKIPLIYDSHELFCEVPELQHSSLKKGIWQWLEGKIIPKLNYCVTVNQSIATIYTKLYGTKFVVVRNIPPEISFEKKSKEELYLPLDKKLILLQGSGINVQRGAEELIEAMLDVDDALLLIIGGGDVWPVLEALVKQFKLSHKVKLIPKMAKEKLMQYTVLADLAISIDKNTNQNYYNSLPNKLFDYLYAEVPVLASRLPEIERILVTFEVGDFITNHEPKTIAAKINEMLHSPKLLQYKNNTIRVKKELSWQAEKQVLAQLIRKAVSDYEGGPVLK